MLAWQPRLPPASYHKATLRSIMRRAFIKAHNLRMRARPIQDVIFPYIAVRLVPQESSTSFWSDQSIFQQ
jgi:hypothetical protein